MSFSNNPTDIFTKQFVCGAGDNFLFNKSNIYDALRTRMIFGSRAKWTYNFMYVCKYYLRVTSLCSAVAHVQSAITSPGGCGEGL